jgi:hypothetical protein
MNGAFDSLNGKCDVIQFVPLVRPEDVQMLRVVDLVYEFGDIDRLKPRTSTVSNDYDPTDGYTLAGNVPPEHTVEYEAMVIKLKVVEVFNGQLFVDPPRGLAANHTWTAKPPYLSPIDNNPPFIESGTFIAGYPENASTVQL